MNKEKISLLRQTFGRLLREAFMLRKVLLRGEALVLGSVYELKRKCGKETCICQTKGELHTSIVISWKKKSHSKLRVLNQSEIAVLKEATAERLKFRKAKARLAKIFQELLKVVDRIEELRRREPS